MEIIVAIIVAVALGVGSVSFVAIKYAAHRPANGELHTLARLEKKIVQNQECLLKHFAGDVSHIHITNHKVQGV